MRRASERARVTTEREAAEISWQSRQLLIARARTVTDAAALVNKFEAVGASRPAQLDDGDLAVLETMIGFWEQEVGDNLPTDIKLLRYMLPADTARRRLG